MLTLEEQCVNFICFQLWRNHIKYFNDILIKICRSYKNPNFDIFSTLTNCWKSVLECDLIKYQNLTEPPTKRTKLMLTPPDVWLSELEIPLHLSAKVLSTFKVIFFEIGIWFFHDILILTRNDTFFSLSGEDLDNLLNDVKYKIIDSYSGFLSMKKMFEETYKKNQY